ncbi:MAG: HAD hydrolase-like protein [Olsenella sp.]|jgi:phosphoglycolate phosphatase|nr:HAD hydrolase-like protein [Olsenella sp.]
MTRAVLFDLDGTLTASGEGIVRSVQYALEQMGREVPDPSALTVFIGPPLVQEFMDFSGMTHDEAFRALELYRERYTTVGLFENHPYQGIVELLGSLRAAGIITCVASSKPEPFVLRILDHFGMTELFDQVVGATLDEKRTAKADVIDEALARLGMRDEKDSVIMVGDRAQDARGALAASVGFVGVTYGYGTRGELLDAGAHTIVDTVDELGRVLLA